MLRKTLAVLCRSGANGGVTPTRLFDVDCQGANVTPCAPWRAKRWRVVPGSRASRGVESLWRFSAAGRPGSAKQNNAARPKAREGLGCPVAHTEGRGTTCPLISNSDQKDTDG